MASQANILSATESANEITRKILKFLDLKKHYCSRIQSQGQYNPTKGRWTKSTVRRGIGDILAIIDGKAVMIEVKAGKDRMSEWQVKTKQDVENSGGIYLVVRSFDDFKNYYDVSVGNR